MTDPDERARLQRLQEVRAGMETLHVDALGERGGRIFSTEETVAQARRRNLATDTTAS